MVCEVSVTRRTFLKTIGSGALTVTVSTVTSLLDGCVTRPSEGQSSPRLTGSTSHEAARPDQTTDWAPEPGKARWRIEGVSKVTGAKIYASDFKAGDFEGWPKQENWLYALRCDRVNQVVVDFNLNVLPRGLQPIAVITSDTLEHNDIPTSGDSNPDFKAGIELFARRGKPAGCYGQPIALLIFDSFDIYRHARKLLDFNPHVIQYGASEPAQTDAPGSFDDNANPFKQAKIYVRNDERQFWNTKMEPDLSGNPSDAFAQQCHHERDIITSQAASNAKAGNWREFGTADGNIFETPAMDPMFMEPESGLAWYDEDSKTMWLVLGTQSAIDDGTTAISLFGKSTLQPDHAHVIACYPGGGFGGRDKSYFPAYLALAARFAKCPLRWQLSRYEQFQVGLKRSETRFEESIWLDRHGKIQALDSKFLLNAGGRRNLTGSVGDLAAMSAMNCYEIPRACAEGTTVYSPEIYGGSQRGFGGPQAFMAIETLLDEAAHALGKSPFEIRRANLLGAPGSRTITGGKILFDLQLSQHLNELESHPLWTRREKTRAERANQKLRYGVGLAMSNQAYGTGKDGVFAIVEIQQDAGLYVRTNYTDMGNGAATTLALAPAAHLGQNAQRISMSEVDAFLIDSFDVKPLGRWSTNPQVKGLSAPFGSSSACLGAFHHYQAVDRASMTLMLHSVLPAARLLWRDQKIQLEDVRWVAGKLTTSGHSALSWPTLLDEIDRMQWDTVAAVHVTYAGDFWRSSYSLRSGERMMDCDFIATGQEVRNLKALTHGKLIQPNEITIGYGRTNYAPAAALVAVSVAADTGHVKVERVVTTLSAGHLICPQIVEGQSQGAVAMAIGNVLSEQCPLGPAGPGNGRWNLDRYQITRMPDVPAQQLINLRPGDGKHRHEARGIGEAVMCPVAPALLNALAMATGHRFRRTPVTPDVIREALK
ncbi:xanthine dehydrogenase family protein molybdopterin-binding subunit [Paraburkholderia sp. HD33-4]|uniref:xanthine dehydrogenase family protein molybdopterin-binding subunit n=1 Tax=Paraburkholderia sp. HD33-4 TaxID=2883242 RepID=UPI001F3E19C0|nr:molybdopterin cofactor-binding domain-containing protein [Paraburkholderia sp. HD33-4]